VIQVRQGQPVARVTHVAATLLGLKTSFERGRTYADQVRLARARWKKALGDDAALFEEARGLLKSMYPGDLGACMYCERSEASEIDHFKSMVWYPGHIFDWLNYVYSCSVCNKKKGSKLRLHDAQGREINYTRRRGVTPVPPPDGSSLLINPRCEDPMQFLWLDLGTGMLTELSPKGSLTHRRAVHTLTKLGLNKRELPAERKAMYERAYRASLLEYVNAKRPGTTVPQPNWGGLAHRLIWQEMKRQQAHPDLRALFAAAPEAHGW
jgi:5-methylcytosine-specific restriction endonuclease McrA